MVGKPMQVKILDAKSLLNDFFSVSEARLQHEKFDGGWSAPVRRLNLDRGEAVAVLIYVQDIQRFVLVRQFRYAVYLADEGGWIDEIVAGVLDGDTPLQCARRECIEEAGYEIDRFEPIATVYSSPGITTERVYVYIGFCNQADKKYSGGGVDHEHEDIQIVELSRDEALEKLRRKEFNDGKTIMALQHFFLNYSGLMK
jgi:ADP-ribose pyrophosphatase